MRKVMYCLTSVMVVVMLIGFSTGFVQAGPCDPPAAINTANFPPPDTVSADNPYLPLSVRGNTFVYEADTDEGLVRNYIYFTGTTVNFEGVDLDVVYDVEWI